MPPLSDLPGDVSRDRLLKSLRKAGFIIDMRGGDGSHCKAEWPRNHKEISIKFRLNKYTLKYLLKEIEQISGVTWDELKLDY
jgi:hypothetical protein